MSDNVNFDQTEKSDLVFQASPFINAGRSGARAELQFSYRLNTRKFTDQTDNDSIEHQFQGSGSVELVDRRLYVDGGLSIKEGSRDNTLFARLDSLGERDDQETFLTWYVEPEWFLPIGDWAGQVVSYEARGGRSLDRSDSLGGITHQLNWKLDNSRQYDEFNWEINYNDRFNDEDGDVESIREQSLVGAFRWWLREDFALLGRVGHERDRFGGSELGDDDTFWSVGASYLPLDYLLLSAFIGPDDKEFRVRFNPNSRLSAVIGYLDRTAGFNNANQWFGNIFYQTKHSIFSSQYSEQTADSFGFNQSTSTFGEASGLNGLGSSTLEDLGIDQDILDQSVSLTQFIQGRFVRRNWSNQWRWSRRRNSSGISYSIEHIIPVSDGTGQRNQQASYDFTRNHGRNQFSRWFVSWFGSDLEGQSSSNSDLSVFGYRYENRLSRELTWGVQYTFRELHLRNDSNIIENRLTAFLNIQFGVGGENSGSPANSGSQGGAGSGDEAEVSRPRGSSSGGDVGSNNVPINDISDFQPGRFRGSRGGRSLAR